MHAKARETRCALASDNPFDRGALKAFKRDYSGMHGVGGIGGSGIDIIGGSARVGDSE